MSKPPLSLPPLWSHGSTIILGQVITWSLLDWLVLVLPLPEAYQLPAILGLAAAQYATLAGWLALGDGSVLVRAGFAAHGILWTELINEKGAPFGIAILMASMFIVIMTAPLALWRLRGWSCRPPEVNDKGSTLRRRQFGIWHVLVLMTLVAAALGIWRLIPDYYPAIMPTLIVLALILAAQNWAQWIALLSPKLIAALPMAVAAALLSWVSGAAAVTLATGAEDVIVVWTSVLVIYSIVQVLNILILRANGYRLVRSAEPAR